MRKFFRSVLHILCFSRISNKEKFHEIGYLLEQKSYFCLKIILKYPAGDHFGSFLVKTIIFDAKPSFLITVRATYFIRAQIGDFYSKSSQIFVVIFSSKSPFLYEKRFLLSHLKGHIIEAIFGLILSHF